MSNPSTAQKRWLTASTGKLSKVDIGVGHLHLMLKRIVSNVLQVVLRKEMAWALLPLETRQRLYELLPPAPEGRPHNPDVHPLKSLYSKNITGEMRAWQEDLKDGKETKKWRDEALQAGQNRSLGLWDDWKEAHREEVWGPRQDENGETKSAEREVPDSGDEKDVEMD